MVIGQHHQHPPRSHVAVNRLGAPLPQDQRGRALKMFLQFIDRWTVQIVIALDQLLMYMVGYILELLFPLH